MLPSLYGAIGATLDLIDFMSGALPMGPFGISGTLRTSNLGTIAPLRPQLPPE